MQILILGAGTVFLVRTGGIVIGLAVKPLLTQIMTESGKDKNKSELRGLSNGGEWIGSLERILIFIFILFDLPS